MRISFVVLLLCLVLGANSQETTVYKRVSIDLSQADETVFKRAGLDLDHATYIPGKVYINDLASWEIGRMEALGFTVDVIIDDVTQHYAQQTGSRSPLLGCQNLNHNYQTPTNFHLGSMGGYLTYAELLDELDLMGIHYPELISVRQQVGSTVTHQGRKIEWVRISDNPDIDEDEPEVLYTALHHAREPMSMMQMVYYMWYLLENYQSSTEIKSLVNNTEMYFVPCVNPDGYIYNQMIAPDGGGGWRKNMRDNNGNGEFEESEDGVDLNRNYGHQWGVDEEGSSAQPGSVTYRGESAFSEPETRAMRKFIQEHDFMLALNYHAYGNYILYPWGFSGELSPDSLTYSNYVEVMTRENGYGAGTSEQTLGYLSNGVASDWMYAQHGIIAATPEIGHSHYGFWPPSEEILPYCQTALLKNISLASLTQKFAVASVIKEKYVTKNEGMLNITVKRYGMGQGSIAMAVESLSDNLVILGSIQEVGFELFDEETYTYEYYLKPEAEQGEEYTFVITIDNGSFEAKDTVTRIFTADETALSDNGNDMDAWETPNGSSWNITDEHAYSGELSLTDSPGGSYAKSLINTMALAEPIDLTDAIAAELTFFARWEIEDVIDYAVVEVSTDGENYTSLCGRYSTPGSIFQLANEPIYDGIQKEWVEESMDLSMYAGELVYIRISMVSDLLFELDGIYIDKINVKTYFIDETTSIIPIEPSAFTFNHYPNPSSSNVNVTLDLSELKFSEANLTVYNALGVLVYSRALAQNATSATLPSKEWGPGMYTSILTIDGVAVRSERLIVVR